MNMDDLNRSAAVGDAYLGNLGNQVQLPILDIDGDATNSTAARINDIFNLVSEHSRQLERVATLIENQDRTIAALSDKLDRIAGVVMTIRSTTPLDQEEIEITGPDAQKTRVVTTQVPYAVIRNLWLDHMEQDTVFPVSMKYLSELCGHCFGPIDSKVKSKLGTMLSIQISQIATSYTSGKFILQVLSSEQTKECSDMIAGLMNVIRRLGTTYAFMIPKELAILLNRVDSIGTDKLVLKKDHNTKDMVGLGIGYDELTTGYITSPRIMAAFARIASRDYGTSAAKALLKHMRSHNIDKDGKYIRAATTRKVSAFNGEMIKPEQDHTGEFIEQPDLQDGPVVDITKILSPVKLSKCRDPMQHD